MKRVVGLGDEAIVQKFEQNVKKEYSLDRLVIVGCLPTTQTNNGIGLPGVEERTACSPTAQLWPCYSGRANCLLPTAYCLLPTAYCPPPTSGILT